MRRKFSLGKIVLSCIAIALIAAPVMSFADTVTPAEKIDLKIGEFNERLEAKAADVIEKRDAYRAKLTEVIGSYAPELQSSFDTLWDEHDALHTSLIAERERIVSVNAAEGKAFMDSIKASVLAGDLTREEAKAQIEAYRAGMKAEREATKSEIDVLKATYDVPEGTIKTLNDAIKTAVEADDATAVSVALTDLMNSLSQHLTFDQAKLELLVTK